jgi:hypothetical protein
VVAIHQARALRVGGSLVGTGNGVPSTVGVQRKLQYPVGTSAPVSAV